VTANGTAGAWTADAALPNSPAAGSASFGLTNKAVTIQVVLHGGEREKTLPLHPFPHPLTATVLRNSKPVAGYKVTFSLAASCNCHFGSTTGRTQVTVTTDAAGIATTPTIWAGRTVGQFSASARSPKATGVAHSVLIVAKKPVKKPVRRPIVPPVHTGMPWSSWYYWALMALLGGVGVLLIASKRRSAVVLAWRSRGAGSSRVPSGRS
jgi:hypothetical protein